MTTQPNAALYTQGFGTRPERVEVPFIANAAPTSGDTNHPIGKRWIDQVGNSEYTLTSISTIGGVASATWLSLAGGSSQVSTLTGDSGTATPSGGNIQIAGTANQISTVGSGAAVTLSLPAAITAPGSLTTTTSLAATTTITAGTGLTVTTGGLTVSAGGAVITGTTQINSTGAASTTIGVGGTGSVTIGNSTGNVATNGTLTSAGNITATNGNLSLSTAGNKIIIATGSNASLGTSSAMSGTPGAVTVATTASSATAKIFYARATTGGTPGQVSITAQDGTGFTLTSTGNETSTFNWWIINA